MDFLTAHGHNRRYYKLQSYSPYDYQKRFHSLRAGEKVAKARALMAANQIGKTVSGGAETAYHATGLYPDWWDGIRFDKAPHIVCSGVNSYRTRDLLQKELLGTTDKDSQEVGTGWLPQHLIKKIDRKPGIPGAAEKIYVQHKNGTTVIVLLGYEDGPKKVMGERIDFGWCDEEPPPDIWAQYVRGTIATNGKLMMTFTPEEGMTQVVYKFLHEKPPTYAIMQATWDDAPHITDERKEELLAEMLPHERDMRSKGEPVVGDAMIFPISDDQISCDPFEIPNHWYQIMGVDFGSDHPFACVKIAYDPTSERPTGYVCAAEKQRRLKIPEESSMMRGMGAEHIPVAWPHDGNKQDKQSGKPMADLYREERVNMLPQCFSNPPEPGKPEGTGGQGREVGLKRMYWDMVEGRLKVFSHLHEWFKEKSSYHKKDGKVVDINDDLLSATRYAHQSALNPDGQFRFAMPTHTHYEPYIPQQGLVNW